ncbi:MAG: hypothetical protein OXR82_02005 [Gammaproteobacteria bacterium]|nr:hypothetical protein [Gammaproteobacteria bacterium]
MTSTHQTEDPQALADERLEAALEKAGARDPRGVCRERLRELKGVDAAAFEQALGHYRDRLIPSIAAGEEPITAWVEYGRTIARLTFEGRTVAIDRTGLAREYATPADPEALVLHLPDGGRGRALLVAQPRDPSPAQQATRDLLVDGRSTLREG